jgi:menaquinone-dependent protoporphyrinogen oxidase
MEKKVLVAYGSWAGSTAQVAESVAGILEEAGVPASTCPANTVLDLSPYRAVVLGSAIHAGQLHGDVQTFLAMHQKALSQMPVAYFVVCMTMKDDTEENRRTVEGYLKVLHDKYPDIHPVAQGLFAGVMDFSKLSFFFRTMMKVMKLEEGDYRDSKAIRSWTVGLVDKLD